MAVFFVASILGLSVESRVDRMSYSFSSCSRQLSLQARFCKKLLRWFPSGCSVRVWDDFILSVFWHLYSCRSLDRAGRYLAPITPMIRVFLFSFPSRPPPTLPHNCFLRGRFRIFAQWRRVRRLQWKTKTLVCFPLSWSKLFPWDDGWTHGDGRMFHSGLSTACTYSGFVRLC